MAKKRKQRPVPRQYGPTEGEGPGHGQPTRRQPTRPAPRPLPEEAPMLERVPVSDVPPDMVTSPTGMTREQLQQLSNLPAKKAPEPKPAPKPAPAAKPSAKPSAKPTAAAPKPAAKTPAPAPKRIGTLAKKSNIDSVIEDYTGPNYPSSATKVRNFMRDLGIVQKVDEIPMPVAQRIANRLDLVPASKASTILKGTAKGLVSTVKNSTAGIPAALMEFFEISDTSIANLGSSVAKGARTAYRTVQEKAASPLGLGAVFGVAQMLRKAREASDTSEQLDIAKISQPTAEDLVSQQLTQELQLRSRARTLGSTGTNPSALNKILASLNQEDDNPLTSVSVPPSSGFPIS